MKHYRPVLLLLIGLLAVACSNTTNVEYTATHVKDLVQADVFTVISNEHQDILIYDTEKDIIGEYLELASVEIETMGSRSSFDKAMKELVKETEALGANGVLILEKASQESNGKYSNKLKAVAVYALDRMYESEPLVSL